MRHHSALSARDRFSEAVAWAADWLMEGVEDGKTLTFRPYTAAHMLLHTAFGIREVEVGALGSRLEVSPYIASVFVKLAESEPAFFDACVTICETNLNTGGHLSPALRSFIQRNLRGELTRPRPPHRPRTPDFGETLTLYSGVILAADQFALPFTRNEVSAPYSACDAISSALGRCGVRRTYDYLKGLMNHADKAAQRREIQYFGLISRVSDHARSLGIAGAEELIVEVRVGQMLENGFGPRAGEAPKLPHMRIVSD